MHKIRMPAKLWCDHAEGCESGLRAWELDVGEWERACGTALADAVKYTVMMNIAPIFFRNSLQLWVHVPTAQLFVQPCCSGVTPLETLERIRPWQLEMERAQMMTGCKSTLSRKARRRAKANTKSRKEITRPGGAKDCWRPGGGAYDNSTSNNSNTQKGKGGNNTWTLWKRISLLKQPQPCRIRRKHRVQLESSRAIQTWNRGSWV